jgi:hypothetical protein
MPRPRRPAARSGSSPIHHYDAVGPMTGMTTVSQPVLVVENRAFGNRAYCAINEGLGKVMRFGGNDAEVLARLAWLRDTLGPALGRAIRETGGIPLKPLIARGLAMGDEMHQRNVACSSLLLRLLRRRWRARPRTARRSPAASISSARTTSSSSTWRWLRPRRSPIPRAASRGRPSSPP